MNPNFHLLVKQEASDFVGLQLVEINSPEHQVVEPPSECGGQCEPSGSGVPGDPFDASDSRLPHAVHTHPSDFVEKRPWLVEPAIRGIDGRAEGPAAPGAAVTPSSALRGPIEGMVDDVALGKAFME
jgi:hypothetical protein